MEVALWMRNCLPWPHGWTDGRTAVPRPPLGWQQCPGHGEDVGLCVTFPDISISAGFAFTAGTAQSWEGTSAPAASLGTSGCEPGGVLVCLSPGKGHTAPSLLLCPESERMGTTSPVALGLLQAGGQKEDPATAPEPTSSPRQPQKLIPRSGKRHHGPIPTGAETTHSHHHRPHRDHRGQRGAQHSRPPPTDSPYRSVPNSAPR